MRQVLKESDLYEIDQNGNIYNKEKGIKLDGESGYVRIKINDTADKVFRKKKIIANNLLSNPYNYNNVIQIDGDLENFHPSNLMWAETVYGEPIFDKKTDHFVRSKITQMIPRCHSKGKHEYKHYGAKGITVCDEWRNNTLEFVKWSKKNGFYKGAWLLRYDKTKGYNPNNCFWGTSEECFKLNCDMIENIKDLPYENKKIAEKYQITPQRVGQIKNGATLKACD